MKNIGIKNANNYNLQIDMYVAITVIFYSYNSIIFNLHVQ